jgi:hypothetical protein
MTTLLHTSTFAELDLDALADHLARTGARANESALATVAEAATRAGVSRVLVAVLLDRTAPEVVRARAFGRIAGDLAAYMQSGRDGPPDEPALLCA